MSNRTESSTAALATRVISELAARFAAVRRGEFENTVRATLAELAGHLGASAAMVRVDASVGSITAFHHDLSPADGAAAAAQLLALVDGHARPAAPTAPHSTGLIARSDAGPATVTIACSTPGESWHDDALAIVGTAADIIASAAGRVSAECELNREQARYHALVDNAADIMMIIDGAGDLQYASPAAQRTLGLDPVIYVGTSALELVHPDDRALAIESLTTSIASGTGVKEPIELRIVTSDGDYRCLEIVGNNRLDDDIVRGIVLNARDVTDRKRVTDALKTSEARLRAVIDNASDIITVLAPDGRILLTGGTGERLFGSNDEADADNPLARVHPDDLEYAVETMTQMFTGERGPDEPTTVRVANDAGEYRHIETSGVNLFDEPNVGGVLLISRDVTDRIEALEAERTATTRLSALINGQQDAILLVDDDTTVLFVNDEFVRLFRINRPANELLGTKWRDRFGDGWDADELAQHSGRVYEILQDGEIVRREEIQLTDGQTIERDYVPIGHDDGTSEHLWVFRDITDRKQAERSLAGALDDAVAAARARAQFVAAVGHEIRTPMHAILGLLELLATTPFDDDQAGMLGTAQESAHALRRIIDDLLDFSKIEAGRMALDIVDFDLREQFGRYVALFESVAAARGLALTLHIDDDVPQMVQGDPLRLRQIVVNLLDNAVKYTSEGAVRVEVANAGINTIAVRVSDTGIGMSEAAQREIFEPFMQAGPERPREIPGTGLGLAISRRLAEMMMGSLEVESTPGHGSTFTLTIAFEGPAGDAAAADAVTPAPPATSVRRARVLVVEDDAVNQMLAHRQLDRLGHTATIVGSGEEALERAAVEEFDLVLMDRGLPGIDGLEATRRLRGLDGATPRTVPVVAFTAGAFAEDERACRAAGTDGYIAKPVSLEQLERVIAEFVEHSSGNTGAHGTVDRLAELVDDLEDEAIVREIVSLYLTNLDTRAHAIVAAAAGTDPDELSRIAHGLKGPSATVGADELAEWCEHVETEPTAVVDTDELAALVTKTRATLEQWLAR